MNQVRVLADALCDTERLHGDSMAQDQHLYADVLNSERDVTVTTTRWYDASEDVFCTLRRENDDIGTQFFLSIQRSQDFERSDEPDPIECYILSYQYASNVQVSDKWGYPQPDEYPDMSSKRVTMLLNRAMIDSEALERRTKNDRDFWKVVGAYALSDNDIECALMKFLGMEPSLERTRMMGQVITQITKESYGLAVADVLEAIETYYASS